MCQARSGSTATARHTGPVWTGCTSAARELDSQAGSSPRPWTAFTPPMRPWRITNDQCRTPTEKRRHSGKKSRLCLLFRVCGLYYLLPFLLKSGEMAERSKAAVSKTVNGFFPFGGSNPPLSAIFSLALERPFFPFCT